MLLVVVWKDQTKTDLLLTRRIQGISSQDCFWEGFENLQQVAAGVGNAFAQLPRLRGQAAPGLSTLLTD